MQSYTAKPVTVQALQYTAPDGADEAGNVDEIGKVAPARQQSPWDPAGGQNCLIVDVGGRDMLLTPGGYLIKHADGSLTTADQGEFEADYAPSSKAAQTDKNT